MEIRGSEYRFDKLDAFAQFHIVRRLAPIFGDAIAVIANSSLVKGDKKPEDIKFEDINFDELAKNIQPLLATLAKLPDEDMNYALHGLMKGVSMKIPGGGWAKVMTENNIFMFDNIKQDLALMLTLASHSFKANLAGFLNALPSGLKEGALQSKPIG